MVRKKKKADKKKGKKPEDREQQPQDPEEPGSPVFDPLENVPRGETFSEFIKDSLPPPEDLGTDSPGVITDEKLNPLLNQHEEWVEEWIARGRPRYESSPVSLQECNLAGKNLSGRNLEKMNFRKAKLQGTIFIHTTLIGADFTEAEFDENSNFWGADLTAATFRKEGSL